MAKGALQIINRIFLKVVVIMVLLGMVSFLIRNSNIDVLIHLDGDDLLRIPELLSTTTEWWGSGPITFGDVFDGLGVLVLSGGTVVFVGAMIACLLVVIFNIAREFPNDVAEFKK